jgi:hypothetical protein
MRLSVPKLTSPGWSGRSTLFSHVLRRERGDDFLEARISAQWIPVREQLQLAVGQKSGARKPRCLLQLFARELFLAYPGCDDREVLNDVRTVDRIFRHRQHFDRAAAFAQCLLFASQPGIDHAEETKRRRSIERPGSVLQLRHADHRSPFWNRPLWDSAVRTADVILEERLRSTGGIASESVGRDLVNKVFGKSGTLAKKFDTESEREGYRDLFAGIVGPFEILLAIVWLTQTRTRAALTYCSLTCF